MAKTFAVSRRQRQHQGDQEDRDVRPRRPAADHQHQRARRQPGDQHHLHRHRHAPATTSGVNAVEPTGSATTTTSYLQDDGTGLVQLQHLPGRARRRRRDQRHVVVRDHRAARGRVARSRPRRSTPPASPTSTPPTARLDRHRGRRGADGVDQPPALMAAAHRGARLHGGPRRAAHVHAARPTTTRTSSNVEISLRNNTTREQLASDGTWGTDVIAGWYRISPANMNSPATTGPTRRRST